MAEPSPANTGCKICKKNYKDPRFLFCLHSFCLQCIMDKVSEDGGNSIECPICEESTPLPSGGAEFLHQNIRLNDESLQIELLEKLTGSPPSCDSCDEPSVAYCMVEGCDEFMCKDCLRHHERKRKKKALSHTVLTLEEAQSKEKAELIGVLQKHFPSPSKCVKHEKQDLSYHCNTCFRPVCGKCVLEHHKEHKTCKICDNLQDIKESIRTKVATCYESQNSLEETIEEIETTKKNVAQRGEEILSEIEEGFGELHELLHQRHQALTDKAKNIIEAKINRLDDQLRKVKSISDASTHCRSEADTACSQYNNVQLLAVSHPIIRRADSLVEELKTIPMVLCETADMSLAVDRSNLEPLINEFGDVADVTPCPDKVLAIIPRLRVGRNAEMNVKVISKDNQGRKIDHGGSVIKSRLECGKEVVTCQVEDCQNGTYNVRVKSPIEGRHAFHVSVNGEPIRNSPFQIHILPVHDYVNIGIPLQTIDIKRPKGIAFSSRGKLFVSSEVDRCIQVYNSTGDLVSVFGSQLQQSSVPHGIEIRGDTLYVADYGAHKFRCFSLEGEYHGSFCKQGSDVKHLQNPTDIKISPEGKVYVCDRGNNRIQVFSSDARFLLHVIGDFGSDDFVPTGMCFDLVGNLHVTSTSSVVKVITPSYEILREYNCSIDGDSASIAIDAAGFCYIAGGSSLFIMDSTNGDFVHRVDGFDSLGGVGVSPNGSVWVADSKRLVKMAMNFININ